MGSQVKPPIEHQANTLNDHRLKAVDSICRLKVERSAIRRTKVKPYSDALRAFYFLINAKAVPPEGEGFKPVEWKKNLLKSDIYVELRIEF